MVGGSREEVCVKFAHTEKNHFLKIMSLELCMNLGIGDMLKSKKLLKLPNCERSL